jgi:transposase
MRTTNRTYKSGQSGDQASFLPPCLEDYVGRDNPVRAIDAYADSLDLSGLGFGDVGSDGGAGQPPYDPADLLKLYLYGYLHQVRSSRRLEREARRNVELMWLLRGLAPGYRTIANFRKENAAGLKAANRDFVLLARSLDLLGGTLVAIDGAFFHGDAGKASILTEKRLREQMAALDRSIAEYNAALEANDNAEAASAAPGKPFFGCGHHTKTCSPAPAAGDGRDRFGQACRKRRWPDLAHRPGRPAVGQARADRRRLQCADRG